jgi:hypothetical protein
LPLPTDGFDNTGYGNGYGSDAHPSRISFSFQSVAPAPSQRSKDQRVTPSLKRNISDD